MTGTSQLRLLRAAAKFKGVDADEVTTIPYAELERRVAEAFDAGLTQGLEIGYIRGREYHQATNGSQL